MSDDIQASELDRSVMSALRSLARENAETVARHLVAAGRLLEDDPETAFEHTMAAQRRAGRVGVVREAVGLAAYRTGRFAEALSELRTARRILGSSEHLPLMADAERGLGRPERALALADDPGAATLDTAGRVELTIVRSGARRDLRQYDAAVVMLQIPELTGDTKAPYYPRLAYAYADALVEASRVDEAVPWFERAAAADRMGTTDAAARVAALRGDDSSGWADHDAAVDPEFLDALQDDE